MRTATKLMLACSAAFLLLVGGFLVWLVRSIPPPTPPTEELPMLVRDLPSKVDDAKPAFQRRVHEQYPDGIQASILAQDLRRKGFRLHTDIKSGLVIAVLKQQRFPCLFGWVIYWSPDEHDRARKIGARFDPTC